MNEIISKPAPAIPGSVAPLPAPRVPISVRKGAMDDLPFIDALQKKHSKMVGWMPSQQLEGKIKAGHVIVAQGEGKQPAGYCIGQDQYFKRDDVGIIYQMNVVPGKQRALVGAMLLKAQFERSAYGCRLYCCWCAQDIDANRFWEAMGFVPLAFRAGSRGKRRVHIFWQRRIRSGDATTPYWFPAQTNSGSIREDRLVLPIPPGTHWRDVMPMVLPAEEPGADGKPFAAKSGRTKCEAPTLQQPTKARVQFGRPSVEPPPLPAPEKKAKPKQPRLKNDPRLIAAARELRDRWLEQVNAEPAGLLPQGKYDLTAALPSPQRQGPGGNPAATIIALPPPIAA